MRAPLHEVGLLLDAGFVHPARSGRNHLRWMAATNRIASSRVDEVLDLVGMTDAADKKLRSYSLGMKQRLGLAGALIGDPATVILDEPGNGLDPEGIRWIRDFLKYLAGEGRTVLVSSHLMAEMALMADDLLVIGRGRLIEQSTVDAFVAHHATSWVQVKSPQLIELANLLAARGAQTTFSGDPSRPDGGEVHGVEASVIGEVAAANQIVLHELSVRTQSLEDAFLQATAGHRSTSRVERCPKRARHCRHLRRPQRPQRAVLHDRDDECRVDQVPLGLREPGCSLRSPWRSRSWWSSSSDRSVTSASTRSAAWEPVAISPSWSQEPASSRCSCPVRRQRSASPRNPPTARSERPMRPRRTVSGFCSRNCR